VHRQKDGRSYVGAVPRAGRTSGRELQRVAELAALYGDGAVSTTAQQGLVVLNVPDENVQPLVDCLEAEDLRVTPSRFRRGVLACTGLEFCKLAIVETKARSVDLYDELEKRLPEFDEPLTINVNGCPNSCARFQTGDIGLKGSIVDGEEGFQVHLGGSLGEDAGFGRKSRGLKVTADGAADYVERLLRSYLEHRRDGERFAHWARRADEALLK
jgi:sulfite reductase (ferredoxin)